MKFGYCSILPCLAFAGFLSRTISCSKALASNIFSWLKTGPDEEVVVVTHLNNPKGSR